MTIAGTGKLLRTGQIRCVDLAEEALRSAERDQSFNAFVTITAEQALDQARMLDKELHEGRDRGPLHGIPVALKDLYFTRGIRTTNGTKIFSDFIPDYDATVVEKLAAAGAVSVGKLNQHEFAYGISSSNPHYGPVRNPHDPACIPGGSSGGSGVTVATGTVFCAMGSDTGGSIRNPAAFCGVVGLKPTFGRVSRHGCFPLGLTLDTMGPLTRTVEDAALIMNAIAGFDPADESTTHRTEDFLPAADASLDGVRIGRPQNFYLDRLHPEVSAAYDSAVSLAEQLGARIVPVEAPDPAGLNAVARTVLLGEAVAVLTPWLHRRDEIGKDVLAVLDQGRLISASEYINAQRVRRTFQRRWRTMFDSVDALLTPCSPIPAPAIGQPTVMLGGEEEDTRLASTRFIRGVNVLGLPALALPCGMSSDRLPLGLQLIGPAWSEARLLRYGAALEAALPKLTPARPSA